MTAALGALDGGSRGADQPCVERQTFASRRLFDPGLEPFREPEVEPGGASFVAAGGDDGGGGGAPRSGDVGGLEARQGHDELGVAAAQADVHRSRRQLPRDLVGCRGQRLEQDETHCRFQPRGEPLDGGSALGSTRVGSGEQLLAQGLDVHREVHVSHYGTEMAPQQRAGWHLGLRAPQPGRDLRRLTSENAPGRRLGGTRAQMGVQRARTSPSWRDLATTAPVLSQSVPDSIIRPPSTSSHSKRAEHPAGGGATPDVHGQLDRRHPSDRPHPGAQCRREGVGEQREPRVAQAACRRRTGSIPRRRRVGHCPVGRARVGCARRPGRGSAGRHPGRASGGRRTCRVAAARAAPAPAPDRGRRRAAAVVRSPSTAWATSRAVPSWASVAVAFVVDRPVRTTRAVTSASRSPSAGRRKCTVTDSGSGWAATSSIARSAGSMA